MVNGPLARSIEELLEQARAAVDAATPDELAHMHHEQRISFAYGNTALSLRGQTPESLAQLRADVTKAAGPCPCGPCRTRGTDK